MIVHQASAERSFAIDYREMAPAGAFRDLYLDAEGEVVPALATEGSPCRSLSRAPWPAC